MKIITDERLLPAHRPTADITRVVVDLRKIGHSTKLLDDLEECVAVSPYHLSIISLLRLLVHTLKLSKLFIEVWKCSIDERVCTLLDVSIRSIVVSICATNLF